MINHRLEGIFLKLGAGPVDVGPLRGLDLYPPLRVTPVHQGLGVNRFDDRKVATVVLSALLPGTLLESRPIVRGLNLGRFQTLEPVLLVVVEYAKQV